ncbi:MAG: sialate O-acetylesterase [Bernardetiaceae bacterium]|jgi:sialate O-acetylesterase|nr:sialate O-acetylesterase [Bernardetiaceae bacterium]
MKTKILLICFGLCWAAPVLLAQNLRLAKVFGNGMVLQRDAPLPVWGWADPGEKITVKLAGQTQTARANPEGRWQVTFAALPAGGPHTLAVAGKTAQLALSDVLVGEVWICSGQSNMEWTLKQAYSPETIRQWASQPLPIRHLKVRNHLAVQPLADLAEVSGWQGISPETLPDFTAVGFHFARELQAKLNVPIGLVNTSWGGTHSETWTSRQALLTHPELAPAVERIPPSLDQMAEAKKAASQALLERFQPGLNGQPLDEAAAPRPDFDDSAWPTMQLPAFWEGAGLPNLDGVVWFRYKFELTAAEAQAGGELHLGPIDDRDVTYLNGQVVGRTQAYTIPRVYALPAGTLRAGTNVLAVRVDDTGGSGGLYGQPNQLKLVLGNQTEKSLVGSWKCRVASTLATNGVSPNDYATLLFNAMLRPVVPLAMRGVIWYQGESNADRAYQYRQAFPLMINDWRQQWGRDFPFYFVQLASFKAAGGDAQRGSTWAELREAQSLALALPNTGMAVTLDIGETDDIHPRNKHDVGGRLAKVALNQTYRQPTPDQGPTWDATPVQASNGQVTLQFKQVYEGLVVKNPYGYINGFYLAGADQKFYPAQAFLVGDGRSGQVVVRCPQVPQPVAVRYAWADDPHDVNLFNSAGLPAAPFRTDTWPGITVGRKF